MLSFPIVCMVAFGAAIGGVARFALAHLADLVVGQRYVGTFVANQIACVLAGISWGISFTVAADSVPTESTVVAWLTSPIGQGMLTAGLAAALSTWSTLAAEVVALAKLRSWWTLVYPGLTIAGGAICVLIGAQMAPNRGVLDLFA